MNKRIILAVSALIAACAVFVSCSGNSIKDPPIDDEPQESVETPVIGEITTEYDGGYWEEGVSLTEYETPYIIFEYPEDWSEKFVIETVENEDAYLISFNGTGDLDGICIFDVMFGEDQRQESYFLGTYTKDDVSVPVYTNVFEAEPTFSAEQLTHFYELQDCVNDIIVQVQHAEGFIQR